MKKVFIGGSRSITHLNSRIRSRLLNIVNINYQILIGDANGADKVVQEYLKEVRYSNVKVYCSGTNCRNNIGNWDTERIEVSGKLKGIEYYMVKDRKMAHNAGYGLMLWDGKSAGTLSNMLELLKENKRILVYFSPINQFTTISSVDDLNNLINKCNQSFIRRIDKKIHMKKSILAIRQSRQLQLSF